METYLYYYATEDEGGAIKSCRYEINGKIVSKVPGSDEVIKIEPDKEKRQKILKELREGGAK